MWTLTPIGGFLGVVALFYWLIATGRLIPRKTHEAIVAAANERADIWKDLADTRIDTIKLQHDQIDKLLEGSQTMTAVLKSAAHIELDEDTAIPGGVA